MPELIAYLDTCVVSGLAKGDVPARELESIRALMLAFDNGKVELSTSPLTLVELSEIPERYRSPHVDIYDALARIPQARTFQVTPPFRPVDFPHGKRPHPLLDYLNDVLPDRPDAEHVFNALQSGVRWVLTVDEKTFLCHAAELEARFGAMIRSPSDFLSEHVAELSP